MTETKISASLAVHVADMEKHFPYITNSIQEALDFIEQDRLSDASEAIETINHYTNLVMLHYGFIKALAVGYAETNSIEELKEKIT